MMNYVRVGLDQFQMKELPSWSVKPFKLNLKMGPLDDSVSSQGDQIILTPPSIGFGKLLSLNPIAIKSISNFLNRLISMCP